MATASVQLPHATGFTAWFSDFLRKELAPLPLGAGAIVARMVIAASITAILIITFRIPGGAIGALIAFLLSRKSLQSTAQSALAVGSAFLLGGLFIPIGSRFFASVPITHFLWEGISLFIIFFLLRTLTSYVVAINIGAIATAMFVSGIFRPGGAKCRALPMAGVGGVDRRRSDARSGGSLPCHTPWRRCRGGSGRPASTD